MFSLRNALRATCLRSAAVAAAVSPSWDVSKLQASISSVRDEDDECLHSQCSCHSEGEEDEEDVDKSDANHCNQFVQPELSLRLLTICAACTLTEAANQFVQPELSLRLPETIACCHHPIQMASLRVKGRLTL